ncbi:MAG: HDIG domain-containing metalloprotein [Planctomycetota bacterium]
MSSPSPKRSRGRRVAAFELPPGPWATLLTELRQGRVLLRIALCALTAVLLVVMSQGWDPPPNYRPDRVPQRDLVARVGFSRYDAEMTDRARDEARRLALAVYDHNPQPLAQLRAKLLNEVSDLVSVEGFDQVDKDLWAAFSPPLGEGTPQPTAEEQLEQFQRFQEALLPEEANKRFRQALEEAFAAEAPNGLIDELPTEHDANRERIETRVLGAPTFGQVTPVGDVRIDNVANRLQRVLAQKLPSIEVADRVFARLRPQLPVTLQLNRSATEAAQQAAADEVEEKFEEFPAGSVLAAAGERLGEEELELLGRERAAELTGRTLSERLQRVTALLGMYLALFVVCGFYLARLGQDFVNQLPRLVTLLITVVATAAAMLASHGYHTQAEVIPLLLFGMTMAVAAGQVIALLLTASLTLMGVVAVGGDLADSVILLCTSTAAILALDSVRTRSKLLIVGLLAAVVALLTTLGVGTLIGQPWASTARLALLLSLWAVIAGSVMSYVLPLVERVFAVQTDLSLLELGDPTHPLLQELIRRAPGTYNHSITVASLAEAAAESIGARGLLVRVGAYFHDIGKMLKPNYFIENQGRGDNRHDTLAPAMSTLVIIAHVKDGADLARQNNLPECIIDFIQQHHGTTLVEYFYRQETVRRDADPDAAEVDESSFRYPGPKPQTKEAGVLMLSDAVESASRVLVEPTPSRIENLVDEITKKRLEDGQFDECGLTLEEVRKIGDSLIKSLTAVYHGRVKYPDQESA